VELVRGAAGSNLKVSGKDGRQLLGSEVATVKREVPTSLLKTAMTTQEVPMWKLDVAVTTLKWLEKYNSLFSTKESVEEYSSRNSRKIQKTSL
jgi:hypothetical protein